MHNWVIATYKSVLTRILKFKNCLLTKARRKDVQKVWKFPRYYTIKINADVKQVVGWYAISTTIVTTAEHGAAPPCGPDDARRCWSRYWPLTFQTLSFQMTVSLCLILSFWLFSFCLFCAASIFCSMHALPFYIPHAHTRARARARTHTHSEFRIFELFYSPQCRTFVLLNKTFSHLEKKTIVTIENMLDVCLWWRRSSTSEIFRLFCTS